MEYDCIVSVVRWSSIHLGKPQAIIGRILSYTQSSGQSLNCFANCMIGSGSGVSKNAQQYPAGEDYLG